MTGSTGLPKGSRSVQLLPTATYRANRGTIQGRATRYIWAIQHKEWQDLNGRCVGALDRFHQEPNRRAGFCSGPSFPDSAWSAREPVARTTGENAAYNLYLER